ncbi:MAG: nucleotide exchange factor GrpE [Actinomycetota bacterium]
MDDHQTEFQKIQIRDKRKLREEPDGGATVVGVAPPSIPEPEAEARFDDELIEARRQAASHLDDLQRLKAEFDNYRKRTFKEQTRLVELASLGVMSQLLGVLDHFDLAVTAAGQTTDYDRMLKGVQMVHRELKEVLRASGLEIIDAQGKLFDPNVHEAALEVAGDDSGVIVVDGVLRNGYRLKDVVLRPATVKVTQDASAAAPAAGEEPDE